MMVQILGINSEEERKEQKQTARSTLVNSAGYGRTSTIACSHNAHGFAKKLVHPRCTQ